jgi:hypothetical protein
MAHIRPDAPAPIMMTSVSVMTHTHKKAANYTILAFISIKLKTR